MRPCIRIYYSNVSYCLTCFERHIAHHQELKNCICGLWFYVRLWLPGAVIAEYYYYYFFFQLRTADFKAYCAICVRRSNFRHQASPRVAPSGGWRNCGREMSGNFA